MTFSVTQVKKEMKIAIKQYLRSCHIKYIYFKYLFLKAAYGYINSVYLITTVNSGYPSNSHLES